MSNVRIAGALFVLAGGALHTRLAFDEYGSQDLIAVFFLNGIASAIVAAAIGMGRGLLAPVAGVGVSVVSLAAFAVSRSGDGVLGFRGQGLEPAPDGVLTLVVEAAAAIALLWVVFHDRQRLVATVRGAARGSS